MAIAYSRGSLKGSDGDSPDAIRGAIGIREGCLLASSVLATLDSLDTPLELAVGAVLLVLVARVVPGVVPVLLVAPMALLVLPALVVLQLVLPLQYH